MKLSFIAKKKKQHLMTFVDNHDVTKGWNVTADEVLLSRLTNYLGESCVKVIEKPIESVH